MNYKIIFLFLALFWINNVNAQTMIFQENFDTQTSGNFTVFAGTPTYPATFYIFSIYRDPGTNVVLRNTDVNGFENISYVYYVNTSDNYDFITSFYDNTITQYYEIIFTNKTGTLDSYFIDCDDGINGYHSDTQTLNLNNYKDANGWTKIENIINITNNIIKINNVQIFNSNLGVCTYNKTVTEVIFNKNYPFYLDNIILTNTSTSLSLSGTVTFTDVDNTTAPLPGALVYINSTVNDTTDASGAYSISVPDGTYTVSVLKSSAFSSVSAQVVVSGATTHDFTLLYSKGTLGSPNLQNGRITTQYSNNLRAINPWELPSFVWVATKYDAYNGTANDKWYYKAANYDGGNQFSINVEKDKGNYRLYFTSSDIYNNPTSGWHPTINITRYFNSTEIYINQGNIGEQIVHRSTTTRERDAKINFWGTIPYFIVVLIFMAAFSKVREVKRR